MQEEKDLVHQLIEEPISRRRLLKRAGVGAGALSLPALLAACGGDDDEGEEAAATTAAETTAQAADMTFYSVTHGESGNVFWAIYRNGIRDGGELYGVEVKDLDPRPECGRPAAAGRDRVRHSGGGRQRAGHPAGR
jgi:hypothetical protein